MSISDDMQGVSYGRDRYTPAAPCFAIDDDLLLRHQAKILRPEDAVPPYGGTQADLRPTVYRYERLLVPSGLISFVNGRPVIEFGSETLRSIGLRFEFPPDSPVLRDREGLPPRVSVRLVPIGPVATRHWAFRRWLFRWNEPAPVPARPVDAWPALQLLRAEAHRTGWTDRAAGLSLDHLLFATTTISGTPGSEGHGGPGRIPVMVPMDPPPRQVTAGRRPVVAVLDTGCGEHWWLPRFGQQPPADWFVRLEQPRAGSTWLDPEVNGNLVAPSLGLDTHAGHGTFICGILRQLAPDAQVLVYPVMHSDGVVREDDLEDALARIRNRVEAGDADRFVDVVSMSLGWYPEQGGPDIRATVGTALQALTSRGVVIVASAGNDHDVVPLYPAGFSVYSGWQGPRVVSVGARNPNLTRATISNHGTWVTNWYPGVAITSTFPRTFNGSLVPTGIVPPPDASEDLDPDDYHRGYGIWTGTSFAAAIASARAASLLATVAVNSSTALSDVSVGAALPRGIEVVRQVGIDSWPK